MMRINQFVAQATGMSRRAADKAIADGRITINNAPAGLGHTVKPTDSVKLDGRPVRPATTTTIMLHKPVGYVCSRDGQGSKTIYELLPSELQSLKPVGRLDKDSSGLLLLTNDGALANQLTHPRFHKQKIYRIALDKPLSLADRKHIEQGIQLDDGLSQLQLGGQGQHWTITMHEGRNRQIRRTFSARGYTVTNLHRTQFGNYQLGSIQPKKFQLL